MDGIVCDACGASLLIDEDVRYVLRIEGFAAYDPLEITRGDLERDLEREMEAILRRLETMSAEEAQDEVHRSFRFDLCPACWKRFLADPLGGIRARAGGSEGERKERT